MSGPHIEYGHEWIEQSVPLVAIVKHQPFQIRKKLDASAVKRYAEMTRAGMTAPPIKLALIGDVHYLLDGWHRMAAGAMAVDFIDTDSVVAHVAVMDEKEARWVAAHANTVHGVPLKTGEKRGLLGAFIKSGRHKKPRGAVMSYREMAAEIGKPHTTIRGWIQKDFPTLFKRLGSERVGNLSPGLPPGTFVSLDEERISQANEAAQTLRQIGSVLTSAEARDALITILRETLEVMQSSRPAVTTRRRKVNADRDF